MLKIQNVLKNTNASLGSKQPDEVKLTNNSLEELVNDLCNSCCWNQFERVQKLLSSNPKINILLDDGHLFNLAMSNKSLPMLKMLVEYAEKHRPEDTNGDVQLKFDYDLKRILKYGLETHNVPQEIEDFVAGYLKDFDDNASADENLYYERALSITEQAYNHLHDKYEELKVVLLEQRNELTLPIIPESLEHSNFSRIQSTIKDLQQELNDIKQNFAQNHQDLITAFVHQINDFLENQVVDAVLNDKSEEEIDSAVRLNDLSSKDIILSPKDTASSFDYNEYHHYEPNVLGDNSDDHFE